ncbi:hypothetical protein [Streptomyces sp. NRRL F-2664]|uniref:hypothetical protein n=1 Tax=Streptomyces sp. NRRL F-2664 TaxID=1463842 RepID=UPI00131E68E9|nr:hypothetical protein [Streptomyces sp. NRRL F-2664]
MNSDVNNPHDGLQSLVGMEVSAVSFVRDYVELHFDGPVLRALSNPTGVYGGREWRFPAPGSLDLMHRYIGKTVDGCQEDSGRALALHFGDHLFVIPLDDGSSLGPESAHLVGVDRDGGTSPLGGMRIW